MLQNPCKTLGFKKNMVYEIPPGGGGKPYPASGLIGTQNKCLNGEIKKIKVYLFGCQNHITQIHVSMCKQNRPRSTFDQGLLVCSL